MMRINEAMFLNRRDAGRRLAAELKKRSYRDPLVLALPRGGVPVAFEVAQALCAPLDVLLVRKLGAPGHEELGIGAVVDGEQPQVVLNQDTIALLDVRSAYIEEERERQLAEIERRRFLYCGDRPPAIIKNHTVIVVDDGIATGGTVRVALRAVAHAEPQRIVLAVPVAPHDVAAELHRAANEVICLATPKFFQAVSMHYVEFAQTTDAEVIELLAAQREMMMKVRKSA